MSNAGETKPASTTPIHVPAGLRSKVNALGMLISGADEGGYQDGSFLERARWLLKTALDLVDAEAAANEPTRGRVQ